MVVGEAEGVVEDGITEDVAVVEEMDVAAAEVAGVLAGVQGDGEAAVGVEVDQVGAEVPEGGGWVIQLAQGQDLLH